MVYTGDPTSLDVCKRIGISRADLSAMLQQAGTGCEGDEALRTALRPLYKRAVLAVHPDKPQQSGQDRPWFPSQDSFAAVKAAFAIASSVHSARAWLANRWQPTSLADDGADVRAGSSTVGRARGAASADDFSGFMTEMEALRTAYVGSDEERADLLRIYAASATGDLLDEVLPHLWFSEPSDIPRLLVILDEAIVEGSLTKKRRHGAPTATRLRRAVRSANAEAAEAAVALEEARVAAAPRGASSAQSSTQLAIPASLTSLIQARQADRASSWESMADRLAEKYAKAGPKKGKVAKATKKRRK